MVVTGPELRLCFYCHKEGKAPSLLPYLMADGSRRWAHQDCAEQHWKAGGR
jgi:hypothetical protein